jgi:hypothetical protein
MKFRVRVDEVKEVVGKTYADTETVYEQLVTDLDLHAVISAVNQVKK